MMMKVNDISREKEKERQRQIEHKNMKVKSSQLHYKVDIKNIT